MSEVVFQELPRAFTQLAALAVGALGNRVGCVFRDITRRPAG
jgi:hypothetical protein